MGLFQELYGDLNRLVFVYVQNQAGQEVVVPDPHSVQNGNGDDRRLHNRKNHLEVGLYRRASVDHGRLFNFQRNLFDKAGKHKHRKSCAESQVHNADPCRVRQMKNVGELGKCEHNHLERYDHGEQAEQINCFRRHVLDTDNVPCAHGAADNNQRNGNHGDKQRVAETAEEVCLFDRVCVVCHSDKGLFNSLCPAVKAPGQTYIADSEGIFENISLSLKGVQHNNQNRRNPQEREDGEKHRHSCPVLCLPCGGNHFFFSCTSSHYASTSFLVVSLF